MSGEEVTIDGGIDADGLGDIMLSAPFGGSSSVLTIESGADLTLERLNFSYGSVSGSYVPAASNGLDGADGANGMGGYYGAFLGYGVSGTDGGAGGNGEDGGAGVSADDVALIVNEGALTLDKVVFGGNSVSGARGGDCLLYTSDAADE